MSEQPEQTRTPQSIPYPGDESDMAEQPRDEMRDYRGSGQLEGRVALVTGGDSGIGRAVAVAFAKEGADVAIAYLSEHDDAERTGALVREAGRRCVAFPGDLADPQHLTFLAQRTVEEYGRVDVLVNNAAFQQPVEQPEDVTREQWRHTFAVNVESAFFLTQALLPHMPEGSSIINTASITGLRGSGGLLDYSATKGALIALTYALSQALTERGIRVNAVAPGPVWTPLIPATFDEEKTSKFGGDVPYGRPAEPDEIAPSYVFFASNQMSSYYSGEVLAPVGGQTMPG
ncbi:MAG: SDR family oxidoreductase [Candidatus Nanopelagicales bacterium]|jgi:NAD(P)-dependent dehydrogenase (short-subunit alcohol dehydrogenase family)|nr:SDR family oxidoreductase [Candidatus Nanopelagicales bacterium]